MPKNGAGMRRWLGSGCAAALVCTLALGCASPAALAQASGSAATAPAGTHPASNTSAHKSSAKGSSSHKRGKKKATAKGQQKIDPQRAQEIQAALIREHYLSSDVAGTWNESSEEAMRRYQADHGWQSKTVPDARALISLGLGPSNDHLLNPDSAMTTEPVTHAAALTPVSHSADPGARVNATPATPAAPAAAPQHDSSGPQ
jgi:hypothetical protein